MSCGAEVLNLGSIPAPSSGLVAGHCVLCVGRVPSAVSVAAGDIPLATPCRPCTRLIAGVLIVQRVVGTADMCNTGIARKAFSRGLRRGAGALVNVLAGVSILPGVALADTQA